MDLFTADYPIIIDPAYARADNLLFGARIYRSDARLWLHIDLARVVVLAARLIHDQSGYACVLYDGLRTIEAQAAMLDTQRVRENPHWLEEPRLLSPPGTGAHPRGMAIDMALVDADGGLIDMGTKFDDLTEKAHRDYTHAPQVLQNRAILTNGMMEAARQLETPLWPLPQEWWDFRLPPEVYESYDPLSDHILPPQMRCVLEADDSIRNFESGHFDALKTEILEDLNHG